MRGSDFLERFSALQGLSKLSRLGKAHGRISRELCVVAGCHKVSRKCPERGEKRQHHDYRYREVVQRHQRIRIHHP